MSETNYEGQVASKNILEHFYGFFICSAKQLNDDDDADDDDADVTNFQDFFDKHQFF
jgi:hypothetical protein